MRGSQVISSQQKTYTAGRQARSSAILLPRVPLHRILEDNHGQAQSSYTVLYQPKRTKYNFRLCRSIYWENCYEIKRFSAGCGPKNRPVIFHPISVMKSTKLCGQYGQRNAHLIRNAKQEVGLRSLGGSREKKIKCSEFPDTASGNMMITNDQNSCCWSASGFLRVTSFFGAFEPITSSVSPVNRL